MPTYETYTIWKCSDCGEIVEDEPQAKLRECSNESCGTKFASEERNCPDCNRPFSRVLAERGCESCNEGEMEETEVLGKCPECHEYIEEVEQ